MRLANPEFASKAPPALIASLKENLASQEQDLSSVLAKLQSLYTL